MTFLLGISLAVLAQAPEAPAGAPSMAISLILPGRADRVQIVASFAGQAEPSALIDDGTLAFDLPADNIWSAILSLPPDEAQLILRGSVDGVEFVHEEPVRSFKLRSGSALTATWILRGPEKGQYVLERTLGATPRAPKDLVGTGAGGLLSQWGHTPLVVYSGWALLCGLFAASMRTSARERSSDSVGTR